MFTMSLLVKLIQPRKGIEFVLSLSVVGFRGSTIMFLIAAIFEAVVVTTHAIGDHCYRVSSLEPYRTS